MCYVLLHGPSYNGNWFNHHYMSGAYPEVHLALLQGSCVLGVLHGQLLEAPQQV